MPWDGSGTFTPAAAPNNPAVGGQVINPTYYNTTMNDLATGISLCLTHDNQVKPSVAIDWNAKNLTNVAAFSAVSAAFSASATVGTTLGVTGAVTLLSTLAVTGAVTLTVALTRANGGTGISAALTNGQLLIGSTATGNFVAATLTQGAGMSITNGAGSITLAATVTAYPGAGIAVSTGAAWGTSLAAPSGTIVGTSDTQTLTNKRITKRVVAAGATSGSLAANADTTDVFTMLGLTGGITVAAPTGTPTDAQQLILRIKDNGSSRTVAWDAIFVAFNTGLIAATTAGKTHYYGCIYNTNTTKWDVVAYSAEL